MADFLTLSPATTYTYVVRYNYFCSKKYKYSLVKGNFPKKKFSRLSLIAGAKSHFLHSITD